MELFSIIDYLLILTRYLAWVIALVIIPASIVLFFVNLPLGIGSAALFAAALLLGIGLTVIIAPNPLVDRFPQTKKLLIPAIVCLVAACIAAGVIYLLNGGFPDVNLLFA